jgi:large subunit ribosomal protein L6
MSRVAKKPIALGKGVELNIQAENVTVKGPKGTLSIAKPAGVEVKVEDGNALLSANDPALVPLSGTLRAILANMVKGVSEGFERKLELVGVGYRAAVTGKTLGLTLGFSHAVNFPIPDGISMETPSQTEIIIKGIDRQKIGQVCAKIRAIRPPEPYKGKGVRYAGEQITLKEGKKK